MDKGLLPCGGGKRMRAPAGRCVRREKGNGKPNAGAFSGSHKVPLLPGELPEMTECFFRWFALALCPPDCLQDISAASH